jgi:hypothetical protein
MPYYPMSCWRCGTRHVGRCTPAVNRGPSRAEMETRLNVFIFAYASAAEARGHIEMAASVRSLSTPPRGLYT